MHGDLAGRPILKRQAATRSLLGRALGALAAMVASGAPALAALPVGAKAPDFSAQAAQGGQTFQFSLNEALRHGPVVVYFYPAAFTHGCTVEAHDFAAAMPDFKSLNATVIGVSEDKIDTLKKFSVSACQGKFPVAADVDGSIAAGFDAKLASMPSKANRTSYVISPEGKVVESYTAMNPNGHVDRTLAAVKALRGAKPL